MCILVRQGKLDYTGVHCGSSKFTALRQRKVEQEKDKIYATIKQNGLEKK